MLIQYFNQSGREKVKNVNGNEYKFSNVDGELLCDVPEPDCYVFLKYPDLYASKELDCDEFVGDINNIDDVIAFANSVQDSVKYTRRNRLENIVADLKENGYEL